VSNLFYRGLTQIALTQTPSRISLTIMHILATNIKQSQCDFKTSASAYVCQDGPASERSACACRMASCACDNSSVSAAASAVSAYATPARHSGDAHGQMRESLGTEAKRRGMECSLQENLSFVGPCAEMHGRSPGCSAAHEEPSQGAGGCRESSWPLRRGHSPATSWTLSGRLTTTKLETPPPLRRRLHA